MCSRFSLELTPSEIHSFHRLLPHPRNFHKAVFVGDGLAMGIGDRVVLGDSGGVAR
jgi:hypothetical protein